MYSGYLGKKADSKENNFMFLRFLAASLVIFSHNFVLFGLKEPKISIYESIGSIAARMMIRKESLKILEDLMKI
jgi:hypothetical protein